VIMSAEQSDPFVQRSLSYDSSMSNTPLTLFIGMFLPRIIFTRERTKNSHVDIKIIKNRSDQ
jgi:hypothetical protein